MQSNEQRNRALPIQGIADRLAGYIVYFALGEAEPHVPYHSQCALNDFCRDRSRRVRDRSGNPAGNSWGDWTICAERLDHQGRTLFESLAGIDTILLDKTGTLTYGTLEVVDIHSIEGVAVASLLETAVIAESRSEHPVAKAILKKASSVGISPQEPDRLESLPEKELSLLIRVPKSYWATTFSRRTSGALPTRNLSLTDAEIFVARGGKF